MPNPPPDQPDPLSLRVTESKPQGLVLVEGYDAKGFRVSGQTHEGGLLVWPEGLALWTVTNWASIKLADFKPLKTQSLDLLLVGGGPHLRPLDAQTSQNLKDWGLALEWMDSGAAARTYNVLAAEGRLVAAALWPLSRP